MLDSQINKLDKNAAAASLKNCCGSQRWLDAMILSLPFDSFEQMVAKSEEIWWSLTSEDWLEAFCHHPKIGDISSLREKFAASKAWAEGEQSGCAAASEQILQQLAQGNAAYEKKFGYIFIVCATGKSADEMLKLLNERLKNDAAQEILVAAAEQVKITTIRLEKLCRETQSQPTY